MSTTHGTVVQQHAAPLNKIGKFILTRLFARKHKNSIFCCTLAWDTLYGKWYTIHPASRKNFSLGQNERFVGGTATLSHHKGGHYVIIRVLFSFLVVRRTMPARGRHSGKKNKTKKKPHEPMDTPTNRSTQPPRTTEVQQQNVVQQWYSTAHRRKKQPMNPQCVYDNNTTTVQQYSYSRKYAELCQRRGRV